MTGGRDIDGSPAFEWVEGAGHAGVSPAGRWLYAEGTPRGGTEQVGYIVATTGGSPKQVLAPPDVVGIDWDANGRLLFLDRTDPTKAVLVRLDPATGRRQAAATFPGSILSGMPAFPVALAP